MKSDDQDVSKVLNIQGTAEESQPRLEGAKQNDDHHRSDAGWAWVVCLGVCVVNFLTVGQQNSAGVVYAALMKEYTTPRGETGNTYKDIIQDCVSGC